MPSRVPRHRGRSQSPAEPADFYTGIVAELYSPLKSTSFPSDTYAAFVDEHGQPALELGCGDGEPLIALRLRGYDVDGVDSSADMIDRCRQNARAAGITVSLHHQRMEALDLPRTYRSVFLAGPTINLLPDDHTVTAALIAIRRHLTPEGHARVPLFVPAPTPKSQLGVTVEATDPSGALIGVTSISQQRDETARTQTTVLRYEKRDGSGSRSEDRPWTLHWHTPDGFAALAADAGLEVVATTADEGDSPGEPGSE